MARSVPRTFLWAGLAPPVVQVRLTTVLQVAILKPFGPPLHPVPKLPMNRRVPVLPALAVEKDLATTEFLVPPLVRLRNLPALRLLKHRLLHFSPLCRAPTIRVLLGLQLTLIIVLGPVLCVGTRTGDKLAELGRQSDLHITRALPPLVLRPKH